MLRLQRSRSAPGKQKEFKGIIVQEPQSDHVLHRVFCKSSVKNGPIVNWYELNCWTVIVSKFLANPACHVTVYK